ncbi:tetratricopeptide repeat protein [Massilia sp. X63]|uniref:tetratricopeptide repeat protein n=1 Tax=Massilia sp. X63 TaxID=3237285 RepID=UPI0034DDA94D
MAQFRLARLCLMLAAIGVSAPALVSSAYAQQKSDAAAPAAQAAAKDTVRPEMFKLLDPAALKPLIDAKNFAEVQNRITQAEAMPNRTPYEDYVINRMKLSAALGSDNNAAAIPVMEAIIASGRLQPAEQLTYYQALGDANYNAKNYAKAVEWYNRYTKEGGDPAKVRGALSRAQINSGNFGGAKEMLLGSINEAKKAGKAPSENDLRLLGQEANKAKDTEGYLFALENLVQYYPSDDFWMDLLSRGVTRKAGFDEATYGADMLRLEMAAVKAMPPEHYTYLAEVALRDGFPAEAKEVLDAGFAAGVLGKGGDAKAHNALRSKATKQAADDAKTIASGEASAAKSKTGAGLVNLGWAYATMGQADKGVGFIQQGIAKGGLKAPDEAKLRLGMAQARAGKKAEAIQTFQGINGKGGAADLAKYWVVLLQQQGGAVAAQ